MYHCLRRFYYNVFYNLIEDEILKGVLSSMNNYFEKQTATYRRKYFLFSKCFTMDIQVLYLWGDVILKGKVFRDINMQ